MRDAAAQPVVLPYYSASCAVVITVGVSANSQN